MGDAWRRRFWGFGAVLAACGAVAAGGSASASADLLGPLSWRAPESVASLAGGRAVARISCPSEQLCVAIAGTSVVTSTAPRSGAGSWSQTPVDPGTEPCTESASCPAASLQGVVCASAALCVAWNNLGYVFTSTDPTGGTAAWSAAKIARLYGSGGVACPSTSLCVALDGEEALASGDPAGGASTWHRALADPTPCTAGAPHCYYIPRRLSAIACPSVSLCVAGDNFGDIVTSTDPGAATPAWNVASVDTSHSPSTVTNVAPEILSISCPEATACVASDQFENLLTSSAPGGGAPAWTVQKFFNLPIHWITRLACPSATRCVGLYNGDGPPNTLEWYAGVSDAPFGGGAWVGTPIDAWPVGRPAFSGLTEVGDADVSCPSIALCVASDELGRVVVGEAQVWDAARLATLLRSATVHHRPGIVGLRRHGGFSFAFTPPVPGTLVVTWSARRAPRSPIETVARGEYSFATIAARPVVVRVTARGRRMLRHRPRLHVAEQVSFAPASGAILPATRETFELRR